MRHPPPGRARHCARKERAVDTVAHLDQRPRKAGALKATKPAGTGFAASHSLRLECSQYISISFSCQLPKRPTPRLSPTAACFTPLILI